MSENDSNERTFHFVARLCANKRCPILPTDDVQAYWDTLWRERLTVFARVFPWVHEAILELARLPTGTVVGIEGAHEHNLAFHAAHEKYMLGYRSDDESVIAIHERQNSQWEQLTKTRPLGSPNDWWTAATMAGAAPPDEFGIDDFRKYSGLIIAWARNEIERSGDPAASRFAKGGKGKGLAWQKARSKLEKMAKSGTEYSSREQLADDLSCSRSTIQRAFKESETLRSWAESKRIKSSPQAIGINEVVSDAIPQSKEPDPAELIPDDDVDKILKRLVAQAPEEKRADLESTFSNGSPEKRREWATVYNPDDDWRGNNINGRQRL